MPSLVNLIAKALPLLAGFIPRNFVQLRQIQFCLLHWYCERDKPYHGAASLVSQEYSKIKGKHIINLLDCGYLCMHLDGAIFEINALAEDMLEFSKHDLKASNFFHQWVSPEQGVALVEQVMKSEQIQGFSFEVKLEDGSILHLSLNAQLVYCPDSQLQCIECLLKDENETIQGQQAFDETLRNISGSVAHLINNKMTSVVGNADMIKQELADQPKLAEKLNRISSSGLDASHVAHSLVSYADTQELETLQPVCLRQVSTHVAEQYHANVFTVQPRNVSFEIAKDLPVFLGHQDQITQLLSYLLDNAIEATEQGGTIIVSSKVTQLKQKTSKENAAYIELAVEDHGHGMDPSTQRRIFEPFFSTRFMGRGMSLAHVLKIIKLHQGRIHVKTGLKKGSIFKIYFPVQDDNPPA